MITLDIKVNGRTIDHVKVVNVKKHKGNHYIYEAYRGDDDEPFAAVSHNRAMPWWWLFSKVFDVMKHELDEGRKVLDEE